MKNDNEDVNAQRKRDDESATTQGHEVREPSIMNSTGPILSNPAYRNVEPQNCSAPCVFYLTGNEYASARQIASTFRLDYDALRKRLERYHKQNGEGVVRVEDPAQNQPKYLYHLRSVLPEIEALQFGKNVHRKKSS